MNTGLYAACAGLLARTQALDLAAHNLANLNTSGFKGQTPTFRSLLASANSEVSDRVRAIHQFGVLGDTRTDLRAGAIERTGNDLDFAIEGDGFFAVQSGGGTVYTRNGNFQLNRQGQLIAPDGNLVLGAQGPILIPPGKVSVSSDGTISVDGALAGQLTLTHFYPGTELTPIGAAYFTAPAAAARMGGGNGFVVQGALEGSNVNGLAAAVDLVSLQRNAQMLQTALTAFHSNFNRIAAQDLARV